jgi:hypothetical protein
MARVEFIEHKGRRLLRTDVSFLGPEDAVATLREAHATVQLLPPQRVLLSLIVVTGMRFDPKVIEEMKRVGKLDEPWVLATAVVGLSAIGRVLSRVVSMFTGRRFAAFASVEEAKAWLVEQRAAAGGAPGAALGQKQ